MQVAACTSGTSVLLPNTSTLVWQKASGVRDQASSVTGGLYLVDMQVHRSLLLLCRPYFVDHRVVRVEPVRIGHGDDLSAIV